MAPGQYRSPDSARASDDPAGRISPPACPLLLPVALAILVRAPRADTALRRGDRVVALRAASLAEQECLDAHLLVPAVAVVRRDLIRAALRAAAGLSPLLADERQGEHLEQVARCIDGRVCVRALRRLRSLQHGRLAGGRLDVALMRYSGSSATMAQSVSFGMIARGGSTPRRNHGDDGVQGRIDGSLVDGPG